MGLRSKAGISLKRSVRSASNCPRMLPHVPVLLSTVLHHLNLHPQDPVIDATLGGGGHARAILDQTAPDGPLLGIEADERTFNLTQQTLKPFGDRCRLVHGNFRHINQYVSDHHFPPVAGILLDLGLSSIALDDASRGFSFQTVGPIDMRFDASRQTLTAAEILNTWPEADIARVLYDYGEERQSRRIAKAIIDYRRQQPFSTTEELARVVEEVKPRRGKTHPATQTFQALRIAVNDELGVLQEALPKAITLLRPGGRLAVITFHSLEDRLVKQWSRQAAADGLVTLVNKKVLKPDRAEQVANPRSRSAKLRIIQKK